MPTPIPPRPLGSRFREALVLASELHAGQAKKGTDTPYAAHLLGVASIALEHGADEDQAIAALLHDAIEDVGTHVRSQIRARFGERVLGIVEDCTDADTVPKPPWRERKERYLGHLANVREGSLLVSMADKLHNVRSIVTDLHRAGESVWSRFRGGKEGSLWYYRALVGAFRTRVSSALLDELDRTVSEMERLAAGAGRSPAD